MKIRLLHDAAFDIPQPRLGYWIDIVPLRHAEADPLTYAIGAQDLNGVVQSRVNHLISSEYPSRVVALAAWSTGFEVTGYEHHEHIRNLTDQLLADGLAREL